jgi:hypothetical protein
MRDCRFTFLISAEERRQLEALAAREERTQSDMLRVLLRRAVRDLDGDSAEQGTAGPRD